MNWTALALAAACLLPLTGCSKPDDVRPPIPDPPEVVRVFPPAARLADCTAPTYQPGLTWSQLAEWAAEVQRTLAQCNEDKAALRRWATE